MCKCSLQIIDVWLKFTHEREPSWRVRQPRPKRSSYDSTTPNKLASFSFMIENQIIWFEEFFIALLVRFSSMNECILCIILEFGEKLMRWRERCSYDYFNTQLKEKCHVSRKHFYLRYRAKGKMPCQTKTFHIINF